MSEPIQPANNSFPFEAMTLANPHGLQGGAYFSNLRIAGEPVLIQTPKCLTKNGIHKTGKKIYCDFLFSQENETFTNWIQALETHVKNLIYEKRRTWFHNDMDYDSIDYHWQNLLRAYKGNKSLLRCFFPKSKGLYANTIQIYDENENKKTLDDVNEKSHLISILEVSGLKFTSQSFQIEFIVKQTMLIKNEPLFSKCLIKISNKTKATPEISKSEHNQNIFQGGAQEQEGSQENSQENFDNMSEVSIDDIENVELNITSLNVSNDDNHAKMSECETKNTNTVTNSNAAPDAETTTPDAAPDAETTTPDAETTTPDAETTTPDAETTTPDAETTTPDAETTTPDAETTASDACTDATTAPDACTDATTAPDAAPAADTTDVNLNDINGSNSVAESANISQTNEIAVNETIVENLINAEKKNENELKRANGSKDKNEPKVITKINDAPLEKSNSSFKLKEESLEKSSIISEINILPPDSMGDTVILKNPNEVYMEIYQEAKRKAKNAKRLAVHAYLEAKRIRSLYLLDEIESSEDEMDFEECAN